MAIGLMGVEVSALISCCIIISQKDELTASIHYRDRFSKSGMPIYNSEIPEKWLRRRTKVSRKLHASKRKKRELVKI